MMNQKQLFIGVVSLLGAFMMGSCAHDGELDNTKGDSNERLQISLSFEQFNADIENVGGPKKGTRALPETKTIDLGNGLELEMAVEIDKPAPQTRATTLHDGPYTIIAIDKDGNRAGKMTGTVTAGKFVKDAGPAVVLPNGEKFTFVCFNAAVTDDGSKLKFNDLNLHPNETDIPLIGRTEEVTIVPGKNYIPFEMKRQVGRIRVKLQSYTADAKNLNMKLQGGHRHHRQAFYIPSTAAYAGIGGPGSGYNDGVVENLSFDASGVPYHSIVKAHDQLTPYYYFMPKLPGLTGFFFGDFKLEFTRGTLYGKTLPTTSYFISSIFGSAEDFKANGSYTVTFKVKSKDHLLLFQDGTVGYYGDRTTDRMPIGIVVDEKKTETTKGTAMALKNAGEGSAHMDSWCCPLVNYPDHWLFNDVYSGYDYTYSTADDIYTEWDKYKEWYVAKTNMAELVRISDNKPMFPAYHMAAHYQSNPLPDAGSSIKWFLPSSIEWKYFLKNIGLVPDILFDRNQTEYKYWPNIDKMQAALTNNGGEFPMGEYHVAGVEYSGYAMVMTLLFRPQSETSVLLGGNYGRFSYGYFRPFTHY